MSPAGTPACAADRRGWARIEDRGGRSFPRLPSATAATSSSGPSSCRSCSSRWGAPSRSGRGWESFYTRTRHPGATPGPTASSPARSFPVRPPASRLAW